MAWPKVSRKNRLIATIAIAFSFVVTELVSKWQRILPQQYLTWMV